MSTFSRGFAQCNADYQQDPCLPSVSRLINLTLDTSTEIHPIDQAARSVPLLNDHLLEGTQ